MNIAALVVHAQDDEERIPKDQYIKVLRRAKIDNIYFFTSFEQMLHKRAEIEERDILLLNNPSQILFDFSYFLSHCSKNGSALLTYTRNAGQELYYCKHKQLSIEKRPPDLYYDGYINSQIYYLTRKGLLNLTSSDDLVVQEGIPCPISSTSSLAPALFLDRDGVIIEDSKYLFKPEDAKIYPEVVDIIKEANRRHWYVFVLTNQSGVARGYFNEKDVIKLHNYLDRKLQDLGAYINHWHYSPFFEGGLGEYNRISLLRKPDPAMVLNACHRLPVDLNNSFMIGDKKSDIISLAGLRTLLIQRSYDLENANAPVFFDLSTLKDYLF